MPHLICYLCGNEVESEANRDHVPPQQFFAPEIRRVRNLDSLTTLPTHPACNRAYSHDEEYAVASLVVPAMGSISADALIRHHASKFQAGSMQGLARKILSSFDRRPSGLVLPRNAVAIRLEGHRIERVVWKIVRGLYYIDKGSFLPEDTPHMVEMREPENRDTSDLDELWEHVKARPSRGEYQGVFAYKYLEIDTHGEHLHAWSMLWWDRMIWYVAHADPTVSHVAPAV